MKKGDRVYTQDGSAAEYVGGLDGAIIVRQLLETEDGEVLGGAIEFCERVYSKAPTRIIDIQIAAKRATLDELNTAVLEARRQLTEANRDMAGVKERLSQHEALKRIDDCLAGRFEWFVIHEGWRGLSVVSRDAAVNATDGRWDKWLKLVTLYGDSKGNLQYRINQYKDGSGNSFECWPCFTEEDARATAKRIYDAKVAEWRASPSDGWLAKRWTESAPEWLVVAPDVLEAVQADKAAQKAQKIAALEAQLAAARAE